MPLDPRVIILLGANALLLYLTLLVNSALAGWSIYLLMLGPMLVFPALFLRHRSYFICTLFTGLWVDAALPSAFGLFTIGFLFAGALVFQMRIRFRVEHNYHPIVLAHYLNFFCIVLVTVAMGHPYFSSLGFWWHVVATSLASHLVLLVVAPWFFNFERMLFALCRLDPEPDEFPNL
jgi:cell shape-determining protein MreD